MRMCELLTITLKTDQSILTGESDPTNKSPHPIHKMGPTGILDKVNYLFSGTLVNNGTANSVVIATGMETEVGHIQ